MRELIYAGEEVERLVRERFPHATITDASDGIHPERFQVEAQVDRLDFWWFAVREGFWRVCLGFGLSLCDYGNRLDMDTLISGARALRAARGEKDGNR